MDEAAFLRCDEGCIPSVNSSRSRSENLPRLPFLRGVEAFTSAGFPFSLVFRNLLIPQCSQLHYRSRRSSSLGEYQYCLKIYRRPSYFFRTFFLKKRWIHLFILICICSPFSMLSSTFFCTRVPVQNFNVFNVHLNKKSVIISTVMKFLKNPTPVK